jgi:predicted glycosyltransferase involved in capsule biosynthesis
MTDTKVDGSQLSVIVPVRIDGADRQENIRAITAYLRRHTRDAELILIECDAVRKVPQDVLAQFDQQIFLETTGPFSKAWAMNTGLQLASRDVVAFYDADVMVHQDALRWAINLIAEGKAPAVLPFNGLFVDISGARRASAIAALETGELAFAKADTFYAMQEAAARRVDGGVFLANRDVMLRAGGFNKRMVSYGWEDIEVLLRLERLGYYRRYAPFNLVHLDHFRGSDSIKNEHYSRNEAEYIKVKMMGRRALRSYVDEELRLDEREGGSADVVRRAWSRSSFSVAHAHQLADKIRSRLATR